MTSSPTTSSISGILDQIGAHTLESSPSLPRNLTTVGLTAEWIRLLRRWARQVRAGKIGNRMIDLARENRAQTDATQRTLLAESYYGLSLAREVAAVRRDTYNGLKQHYENALKLEAAGTNLIWPGRLFAQVNMDAAQRALGSSTERSHSGRKRPAHPAQSGRQLQD